MLEDLFKIIYCTEACCLGADKRAAVGKSLTCKNAVFKGCLDSLILTEKVTDLFSAYTDITGRNVYIGADMSVYLLSCSPKNSSK